MRFLDYARLLRLPNVFTALADIALGALVTLHFLPGDPAALWPNFLALMLASACLYSAGMVWNDYFDLDEDRRERPFRPLPSGRIKLRTAVLIGVALLALGCLAAAAAGRYGGAWHPAPLLFAGALVAAVLLYDGWLKRTPLGPVAMGACRFLNVLLGLSLLAPDVFSWGKRLHLAAAVGVYIVGVTWFARTEARTSRRDELLKASGVVLAGLVLALALPVRFEPGSTSAAFPYLLVLFGFLVGLPAEAAIRKPSAERVQAAVKRMVLGLVVLDAVLAQALVGWEGLLILLLLPPGLLLGKWVYST